jgi:hypothetical protein
MNLRLLSLVVILSAGSLFAQTPAAAPTATPAPYKPAVPPPADPPYYRVRYEASTQPKELIFGVTYTIWIPPGVKTLRGIIVHQHGCGEGSCKSGQTAAYDLQWQALARKHDCALLGPSYEQPEKANCGMWCDPRNGSDQKFLQALDDLAVKTGHPELTKIPWATWGHSGGSCWVSTMLLLHPERTIAVWMRSGLPRFLSKEDPSLPELKITPEVCAVPVMCNQGTKEGVTVKDGRFSGLWKNQFPFFTDFRAKGGLVAVAIDPLTTHECGNQRYFAIPWFDACLTARLPPKPGDPLKPMPTGNAWLATINEDGVPGEPQPAAKFSGDATKAVWLPNEIIAKDWAQYVKDTAIEDTTPPPAPTDIKVSANGELTWNADADFESGLAGFIIERDGQELARLPEKPVPSALGRPIFQKNGYSDTPTPPLAEMRYTDTTAKPGEKHEYRIISLNSVGLKPPPSAPASL